MTSWGPIFVPIVVEGADLKVGSAKCEFRLSERSLKNLTPELVQVVSTASTHCTEKSDKVWKAGQSRS